MKIWMLTLLALSAQASTDSGKISGVIAAGKDCDKATNQVWISVERTLLYHAEVPANGTFEFHVKPGKYNVVATGSTGCFFENSVKVSAGETAQAQIKLAARPTNAPSNTKGKK